MYYNIFSLFSRLFTKLFSNYNTFSCTNSNITNTY